jgi:hypothetical protein
MHPVWVNGSRQFDAAPGFLQLSLYWNPSSLLAPKSFSRTEAMPTSTNCQGLAECRTRSESVLVRCAASTKLKPEYVMNNGKTDKDFGLLRHREFNVGRGGRI